MAVDFHFVRKIMRMMAPSKYKTTPIQEIQISIKEFSSLFVADPPNVRMANIIQKKLMEKHEQLPI